VLLDKYSSAEEIYSLPTTDLYEEVGEDFAKKIFSDQNLRWAEREVKWAESKGVKLLLGEMMGTLNFCVSVMMLLLCFFIKDVQI
jgi:hypothetical protein